MKHIIQKSVLIPLLLFGSEAFCQNSFNVSSNKAIIQGNTYEYAIGEMSAVTTSRNTNLIVSQGFLQPNVSSNYGSSPTNVSPFQDLSSYIKVYPNPTENILFIESEERFVGTFIIKLYDAIGNVVISKNEKQTIGQNKFNLTLNNLAAGNYFLFITKPNNAGVSENYSYKIQKTN